MNGGAEGRGVRIGTESRSGGAVLTQAELQVDVERFTGDLMTRIGDAGESLFASVSPSDRQRALKQLLLYESAALDIATDPRPEIALLDMVVFVGLARGVFERHWVHELGKGSEPVLLAFRQSEEQLGGIAAKVLSPAEEEDLHRLIDEWLTANPDRVAVESIRFGEFSELVGRMSAARAAETGGIFGAVRAATATADEALLLADRARFLATRLPFLLRLHARLGVSEISSDALVRLEAIARSLEHMPQPGPLVRDLTSLASETRRTTEEARATLHELAPILAKLPPPEELHRLLGTVERLNDKTLPLLERLQVVLTQLDALLPDSSGASKALDALEHRANGLMIRGALVLVVVGAAWSLLFWLGYCVAKRVLVRLRARSRRARPTRARAVPRPVHGGA
jgi:hypothetical protein